LVFTAPDFNTEKKNAAGKNMAARGIKVYTTHFYPLERLASSTYRHATSEKNKQCTCMGMPRTEKILP
jgi:hypothetical protein